MIWILILIGIAGISVLAVPFFCAREPWALNETPDRLRNLKRARDRSLRILKDLDNDLREGSLLPDDHAELRAAYKLQAIEVSRELDRVREIVIRQVADGADRPLSETDRKTIEAAIARRARKLKEEARK